MKERSTILKGHCGQDWLVEASDSGFQEGLDVLGLQRKPARSFAGGVEECSSYGGGGQRVGSFRPLTVGAHLRPVNENNFDLRKIGHCRDRIAPPVVHDDSALIE